MDERVMQLRVGFLVLATLLITGILVVMFGEFPSPFQPEYTIRIRFDEARGVAPETPVRKSGILIGRVQKVAFVEDVEGIEGKPGVIITAKINRRLRTNEACRVKSTLLGDAVLQIVRSDKVVEGPVEFVEEGGSIDGQAEVSPIEAITDLKADVAKAIGSVTRAADALGSASGDLGNAGLRFTDLINEHEQELDAAIVQADSTLVAVEKAAKDFDELLGDQQTQARLKTAMNNFPELLSQMQRTMARAEQRLDEIGTLTQRLGSPEMIERIERGTTQLDSVMADLAVFTQRLRNPDGSLALLLEDRQLYDHLNRAAANVDDLSRRMKPIVEDVRVFTDKIARHPERLGVRGVLERHPGIK